MSEENPSPTARPRIQTLSDLIFGLALSIGALTLIGQQPSDFNGLLVSILYYAFSFVILISLWRSYTRTMALLPAESTTLINLNILLLFLVSIEPYLFNQLLGASTVEMAQNVSILYAFDLGGLFLILAFFANSLVNQKTRGLPEKLIREYKFRRYNLLVGAALFFISTVPVFWMWSIPLGGHVVVQLRFIFWFIPLLSPTFVHLWERRNQKMNLKHT